MKNLMKKVIAWALSDIEDPLWYLTEEDYADNTPHSLFVIFSSCLMRSGIWWRSDENCEATVKPFLVFFASPLVGRL